MRARRQAYDRRSAMLHQLPALAVLVTRRWRACVRRPGTQPDGVPAATGNLRRVRTDGASSGSAAMT